MDGVNANGKVRGEQANVNYRKEWRRQTKDGM